MEEGELIERDKKSWIDLLSKPLPKEAIQRTKKEDTRKGYDTTGYGYQYAINRFNEIYGDKWGFTWEIIKELSGNYKTGTPYWEITVKLGIYIIGVIDNYRYCVGGHISVLHADALKGAITNAFKKTASFWGVGKEAYEGTIDDDNTPYPDKHENKETPPPRDPFTIALDALKDCKTSEALDKVCKRITATNFTDTQAKTLNDLVEATLNGILSNKVQG